MRTNFTAIKLGDYPPPNIVQDVDYVAIRSAMIADYVQRCDLAGIQAATAPTDPAIKLIETFAYREFYLRYRINKATKAVLFATADETELAFIAERFDVPRILVAAGDADATPPVPPTWEPLERWRERIHLKLESASTAGAEGAYRYHALSASPAVKDVVVDAPTFTRIDTDNESFSLQCTYDAELSNPMPGDVAIIVLSNNSDGTPSAALLDTVKSALSADSVRPLTDNPRVMAAEIIDFEIDAVLSVGTGPDPQTVLNRAKAAIAELTEKQSALGAGITLSAIYAALHQSGVNDVTLLQPAANVNAQPHQAAHCTSISVVLS